MDKNRKTAVPLRRSLTFRVGLLAAGAVILVSTAFFLFGLKPVVERVAENQFALTAARLERNLGRVFDPAEQILRMSRGWLNGKAPDLSSPDGFNRIFLPVLESLPQSTSVVAGTPDGQGWMLLQHPDGRTSNRLTDLNRWGNRHLFFEHDTAGGVEKDWKTLDYDPRKRAWYRAAAESPGRIRWTAPYTFFTTGDPGITAALQFRLKDGRNFVLGLDLKLRDLSHTTMQTEVGKHGFALVLSEDLRVLALPAAPAGMDLQAWSSRVLVNVEDLGIPALATALSVWVPSLDGQVWTFRSQGADWLARMQAFPLGDSRLWVVTLAPADDFAPDWSVLAGILSSSLVLTLLLVFYFSRLQARRIARPLEMLATASERIGLLDFADTPLENSGIREVRSLAQSHEKMRSLLQENQRRLVVQEDELRRQITALHAAEQKIQQSETHFRLLAENASDVVWKLDSEHRCLYVSPADERLRGYRADEVVGQHALEQLSEESAAEVAKAVRQRQAEEAQGVRTGTLTFVALHRCNDGQMIWMESLSTPERDAQGRITGYYGISRDVTQRKQVEDVLRSSEAKLFTILENVDACIYLKDLEGRYQFANKAIRKLLGVADMKDVIGYGDEQFFESTAVEEIKANDRLVLESGEILRREETNRVLSTDVKRVYQSTKLPLRREDGSIYALCGILTDITDLKAHESQLRNMAHYDVLTGLPNRVLLADRMQQAMTQALRRGQLLAVAYLDLDGFKHVNDQYGHQTGDRLLVALSGSMKATLREGDTLARLGGDEFIAVLLDLDGVSASLPMLARLLAAAAQSVTLDDHILQVSASLGVTFYPQGEDVDADQLLRQADQSMYQAKLAGKNRYHVFDADQDRSVRGFHESLEHIRRALDEREFVLYYQPKVNMRTGTVIGVEALIRWQHPERGLLPPSVFLPVIEEHPLAVDVGNWVIDAALEQMEQWAAAGLNLPVSINIGARQLQQDNFFEHLCSRLSAYPGVQPSDLQLEVLETSALKDLERVSAVIEACREIGVRFSLDDFGTGYSSLTYLKRLAVDQLKIDQSFVRDMLDDPDDLAILGGVLSLATAFRREVIAEGVETVRHGTMLLQLGCELAQGYGIARPMPAEEIPLWLAQWTPDVAWINQPPVRREDLPLLFASVEHRAWLVAIKEFLRGERETLPLIHGHCRFYDWLETEIRAGPEGANALRILSALHRKMHLLADEMCARHVQGHDAPDSVRLEELQGLCGVFLVQLEQLMQPTRG